MRITSRGGGQTLDDIELRRTDRVFLDALGTDSLPDPTTAGDFCRRFDEEQIEALMDAINETRLEVWQRCPGLVEETARIDGDGTLVPTTGACKEGMDIAYNGVWGYGPLLVSLANTGEPLFIKNRSANRPSHESAIPYVDKAVALCRRAGFTDVLWRGDTDFALTTAFDRWTTAGVRFVFGYDATATMVRWGQSAPPDLYEALVRRTERTLATAPRQRQRPYRHRSGLQEDHDRERSAGGLRLPADHVHAALPGRGAQEKSVRRTGGAGALRRHPVLFLHHERPRPLVPRSRARGRQRCDQENLIAQLKGGVRALHAPVNTLHANWAYMVMAALAWSLKAWVALELPIAPRWRSRHEAEQRQLLRMDFRTFLGAFINVPCQIVTSGRRVIYRLLAWNPWQYLFLRFVDAT